MERNTTFFKEPLIRKAMGQPATTSNKSPKGPAQKSVRGKMVYTDPFFKTDVFHSVVTV